jgi:FtsH-binding integral membrane protein
MKIVHFVKPGLFVYECVRILAITFILFLQADRAGFSINLILIMSGALFPLMALFIWLNTNRYKAYLPLFLAGKCIGAFTLLIWFIVSKQDTIIESFVLSGDLFSLAAVLLIIRETKKPAETQTNEDASGGG